MNCAPQDFWLREQAALLYHSPFRWAGRQPRLSNTDTPHDAMRVPKPNFPLPAGHEALLFTASSNAWEMLGADFAVGQSIIPPLPMKC